MVTGDADTSELDADAGNFVAVRGEIRAPGRVRVVADTGCRARDRVAGVLRPIAAPDARAPVRRLLDDLRTSGTRWWWYQIACLTTVEAQAVAPPDVTAALARVLPADGRSYPADVDDPVAYTYRDRSTGIVVRVGGGKLIVDATTGC